MFVKVDEKYIKCLDINTPIVVDGVEVTALDANQYVFNHENNLNGLVSTFSI